MQVADGDGQGVGGIHRFRWVGKLEQASDHVLDLLFLGTTVADDRRLYGQRRIFGDLKARRGGCEHGHATDLAEFQGGFDVESVEDVFDRNLVRLMFGDDCAESSEDTGQTAGERFARGKLNRTTGQAGKFAGRLHFDDAVAGVFSAAVDTEDTHVKAVYRGRQGWENDKDVSDDRLLLASAGVKGIPFNVKPSRSQAGWF